MAKRFYFARMFVFPPAPIPFLICLWSACTLAFNNSLRESSNIHLGVTQLNASFLLIFQLSPWILIKPLNLDPQHDKNWTPYKHCIEYNWLQIHQLLFRRLIQCWPHHTLGIWRLAFSLSPTTAPKIHESLKQPIFPCMINLFRRINCSRRPPKALKQPIFDDVSLLRRPSKVHCSPYIQAFYTATCQPNISVTPDVIHHIIHGPHHKILLMLDTRNKIRLFLLKNDTAVACLTQ